MRWESGASSSRKSFTIIARSKNRAAPHFSIRISTGLGQHALDFLARGWNTYPANRILSGWIQVGCDG
jgi:hypothetical protein